MTSGIHGPLEPEARLARSYMAPANWRHYRARDKAPRIEQSCAISPFREITDRATCFRRKHPPDIFEAAVGRRRGQHRTRHGGKETPVRVSASIASLKHQGETPFPTRNQSAPSAVFLSSVAPLNTMKLPPGTSHAMADPFGVPASKTRIPCTPAPDYGGRWPACLGGPAQLRSSVTSGWSVADTSTTSETRGTRPLHSVGHLPLGSASLAKRSSLCDLRCLPAESRA